MYKIKDASHPTNISKNFENESGKNESVFIKVFFSAECAIGMVWGLTALNHYGNKALCHYGNKALCHYGNKV